MNDMNELQVLEFIEATSSSKAKIELLRKHRTTELQELLEAALPFNRKYYIKKFNVLPVQKKPMLNSHAGLLYILDKLETREWVGNKAIAEVEGFLANCDELQAKWYSRVIRKDLQAGFTDTIANKAGYGLPEFNVMLAKDGKKSKNLTNTIHKGGWFSPKLDGYRCLAVKDYDDVTLYSRNGKVYTNFPLIEESIRSLPQDQLVLDGEIMSNSFNAMQTMAFSDSVNDKTQDATYHIFDMIPYEEWASGKFTLSATDRLAQKAALNSLFTLLKITNITTVPHVLVTTMQEIKELEQKFISNGYEGGMFLPKDCPYYRGRKSNKLMKFKTMQSMDCKIKSCYEGTNKYVNMLGGIQVVQENGIICSCGSGFNDEQRSSFWDNQDALIGRIAEIKYQELTPDGVMRFPIFIRFRDKGSNTGKI